MEWIDVSRPLAPGMPTFEGDPEVRFELAASMADGALCNVTRLDLGAHSGTHLDAPGHFIPGAPMSEAIDLEALIGPAVVVDATRATAHLTAEDIAAFAIPAAETRVLFKTPNSGLWDVDRFSTMFLAIAPDGAVALVDRGTRLVGIDYLSVAPFDDPAPTHRTLLGAGVAVLEGLDLREVEPGAYDLLCLPIRLVGSDGAPARALLRPRA
jgi:arylformamidase